MSRQTPGSGLPASEWQSCCGRNQLHCLVKDGLALEEAELDATWNQQTRSEDEQKIKYSKMKYSESLFLVINDVKVLQYLTREWHRFIENIFPAHKHQSTLRHPTSQLCMT